MSACDAMMAAAVASTTIGSSDQAGTIRKNGCSAALGSISSMAPWPK